MLAASGILGNMLCASLFTSIMEDEVLVHLTGPVCFCVHPGPLREACSVLNGLGLSQSPSRVGRDTSSPEAHGWVKVGRQLNKIGVLLGWRKGEWVVHRILRCVHLLQDVYCGLHLGALPWEVRETGLGRGRR